MPADLGALLPFRPKRADARVRLLCFPFAGGAASVYRSWAKLLPDWVDLCAIELAGRGARFGERLMDRPDQVLDDLAVLETLPALPTVVFGHSLGGRVGFALIRRGLKADALIVSASRPAHVQQPLARSSLPQDALVRELRRLGGTPREIIDDPEMLALMLPIVRADFRILETLTASPDDKVLCPLTVLAAAADVEVPLPEIMKWEVHAGAGFRAVTLQAGHFFLSTHTETVLGEIRRVLDEVLAR